MLLVESRDEKQLSFRWYSVSGRLRLSARVEAPLILALQRERQAASGGKNAAAEARSASIDAIAADRGRRLCGRLLQTGGFAGTAWGWTQREDSKRASSGTESQSVLEANRGLRDMADRGSGLVDAGRRGSRRCLVPARAPRISRQANRSVLDRLSRTIACSTPFIDSPRKALERLTPFLPASGAGL